MIVRIATHTRIECEDADVQENSGEDCGLVE